MLLGLHEAVVDGQLPRRPSGHHRDDLGQRILLDETLHEVDPVGMACYVYGIDPGMLLELLDRVYDDLLAFQRQELLGAALHPHPGAHSTGEYDDMVHASRLP